MLNLVDSINVFKLSGLFVCTISLLPLSLLRKFPTSYHQKISSAPFSPRVNYLLATASAVYIDMTNRSVQVREKKHQCHISLNQSDKSALVEHSLLVNRIIDFEETKVLEFRTFILSLSRENSENLNLDLGIQSVALEPQLQNNNNKTSHNAP